MTNFMSDLLSSTLSKDESLDPCLLFKATANSSGDGAPSVLSTVSSTVPIPWAKKEIWSLLLELQS